MLVFLAAPARFQPPPKAVSGFKITPELRTKPYSEESSSGPPLPPGPSRKTGTLQCESLKPILCQKSFRTSPDHETGRGVLFSHSFLPLNQRFRPSQISTQQALISKTRPEQPQPARRLQKISALSNPRDTKVLFQNPWPKHSSCRAQPRLKPGT